MSSPVRLKSHEDAKVCMDVEPQASEDVGGPDGMRGPEPKQVKDVNELARDEGRARRGWTVAFVLFVALALTRLFIAEPYLIPSSSMEPTLMNGDQVLGLKTSLAGAAKRGDIVTFTRPDGVTYVKRVIGLEGDMIDLKDGLVLVNGNSLDEPYIDNQRTESLSSQAGSAGISYPYTVPEGCIFVMGDNREHSRDSRYFGAVEQSWVRAKVILKYTPVNKMRLF